MNYYYLSAFKSTLKSVFILVCASVVVMQPAYAKSSVAAYQSKSESLIEKINQAIDEADKKLVASKMLSEVHKDISDVSVAGSSDSKGEPQDSSGSSDEVSNSELLLKQASSVYKNRSNYVEAYELTEKALVLNPDNKQAAKMKEQIQQDLENDNTNIMNFRDKYTPPAGVLAYKIAVSDNMLTLDEAVEIAQKNSVLIRSLEQRVEAGRAKLYEAKRALYPTASLELKVGGGIVGATDYSNETWKMNMSQPMYYGGELIFTVKQAEAGLKSDKAKLEKERLDVVTQVGEAYRGLVNSIYNHRYQSEAFEEIEVEIDREAKMYEEKLVPEVEHLELQTIFNTAILTLEQAAISLDSAYLTLFQSLGVAMQDPIPVDLVVEHDPVEIDYDSYIRMVQNNNLEIIIKEMDAKQAYYNIKVLDSKKLIRVDARGSFGMSGEVATDHQSGPDLENEHFLVLTASMPLGANTLTKTYQRRFFGPTLSSFRGSEDFEHKLTLGILDNLADITDAEVGKADYTKAQAELTNERVAQELTAKQHYYDYQVALKQIEMSEARMRYREKQIELVKHTTLMADSRLSELINAITGYAEDKFTIISTLNNAKSAIWEMNRAIGIEGYYGE